MSQQELLHWLLQLLTPEQLESWCEMGSEFPVGTKVEAVTFGYDSEEEVEGVFTSRVLLPDGQRRYFGVAEDGARGFVVQ